MCFNDFPRKRNLHFDQGFLRLIFGDTPPLSLDGTCKLAMSEGKS